MIRVALVDDHPLMLKIVRQELARELDLEIVWDCAESSEIMARVAARLPDVLVLDLSFAGQAFDPATAVRDLQARFPSVTILILTANDDPLWIEELLRAGARGYVIKSEAISLKLAGSAADLQAQGLFSLAAGVLALQLAGLIVYGWWQGRAIPFLSGLAAILSGIVLALFVLSPWLIPLAAGLCLLAGAVLLEVQHDQLVRWLAAWLRRLDLAS